MNIKYVIPTNNVLPNHYKFFANEMNISMTKFKKQFKQRTCIVLYIHNWKNEVITEFGSEYDLGKFGFNSDYKIISVEEYKDTKYSLMVSEEKEDTYFFKEIDKSSIEVPKNNLPVLLVGDNPVGYVTSMKNILYDTPVVTELNKSIDPDLAKFFISIQALNQFI